KLTIDDVVSAYGGLRPLTESAEVDTYTASRASELIDHGRHGVVNFLSAMGGKYTSSRAFASRIVTRIGKQLGTGVAASRTAIVPLDGCAITDLPAAVQAIRAKATADEVPDDTAEVLASLYGTSAPDVVALMGEDERLRVRATGDGEPLATVAYAARHEAPVHLVDVLLRRTGIGQMGDPGERVLGLAAAVVAAELRWSPARREEELEVARRAVRLPAD
ncbi:MAG: glycerol-3-phosphate dehydrogenase C-terminal domain-containing protein, partial [Propionicimonas sp.]